MMIYLAIFLPASAVAGQQVIEVQNLIKLQKQEKHYINSQKHLIYHRAAIICMLLLCFSCFVFFVLLCFLVEAAINSQKQLIYHREAEAVAVL